MRGASHARRFHVGRLLQFTARMSAGTTVQITMPEMGESVTEGTVLEWLKQVGDEVEVDEGLLEVSTDKVDAEVPSPASGVLAEILVGPDETVPTGTVLGIIDVSGADGGAPRGHDDLPTGASDFGSGESAVEEATHGAAAEKEHQAAKERASGNGGSAPAATGALV